MRRIALTWAAMFAVSTVLALSTMTGAASAAPPRYPPNRTNGDGVWQKRYGPAGFGWYSIYGDFVGYNGYSWFNYGYPGYFRGGPAYPPGRTNFNRTDSYGFANFPR